MRASFLLATLLLLPGCAGATPTRFAPEKPGPRIAIVYVDGGRYIIDPNTESCFLGLGNAVVGVPCDKLKKNVPAAAEFITWVPDAKTGADAPASTP